MPTFKRKESIAIDGHNLQLVQIKDRPFFLLRIYVKPERRYIYKSTKCLDIEDAMKAAKIIAPGLIARAVRFDTEAVTQRVLKELEEEAALEAKLRKKLSKLSRKERLSHRISTGEVNSAHNPLPSLAFLKTKLTYDPQSGDFRWRGKVKKSGKIAGRVTEAGYRTIAITIETGKCMHYRAHRLAWLFITGEDPGVMTVDHKNRKRDDNRASNLRLADHSDQGLNRGWGNRVKKRGNFYEVKFKCRGEIINLGNIACPLLAQIMLEDGKKAMSHNLIQDQQPLV